MSLMFDIEEKLVKFVIATCTTCKKNNKHKTSQLFNNNDQIFLKDIFLEEIKKKVMIFLILLPGKNISTNGLYIYQRASRLPKISPRNMALSSSARSFRTLIISI